MLALGIDIGTSGVRSVVVDGKRVVSEARAPHPPQDPDRIDARLWWEAVSECLHAQAAALNAQGSDLRDVTAIAVDGTSGSMVLTDASLDPVGPALMYNSKGFDAEAQRIEAVIDGPHITRGTNSALARAMRLVDRAEAKPKHLLHQADYVASKLLGHAAGSDDNNALKTGFDPETRQWPSWVDRVLDPALLPDVHPPGAPLGEISAEVAKTFGFSPNTTLHAGTTDSIAAFIAAAPLQRGMAVTSLGSTLAIKLLSPTRIDDPSIGLYSHRLGDHWLVGGASNTGGAVLRACFDDETLASLSAQIDASVESPLDYYPLLQPGERFPINDPKLPPRLTPRPLQDVDYLHGLLESIARIEAACYREMTARGADWPSEVITAGGGAKNAAWLEIRARHLKVPTSAATQGDAAYGAAQLALS